MAPAGDVVIRPARDLPHGDRVRLANAENEQRKGRLDGNRCWANKADGGECFTPAETDLRLCWEHAREILG